MLILFGICLSLRNFRYKVLIQAIFLLHIVLISGKCTEVYIAKCSFKPFFIFVQLIMTCLSPYARWDVSLGARTPRLHL